MGSDYVECEVVENELYAGITCDFWFKGHVFIVLHHVVIHGYLYNCTCR